MANGIREVEIRRRGVVLTLKIEGKKFNINPSPGDILKLSQRFAEIETKLRREEVEVTDDEGNTTKVPRDPNGDEQAEIADHLLAHCSGEHEAYFRSLPTEMQSSIVNEMWAWFLQLDLPKISADPTTGS